MLRLFLLQALFKQEVSETVLRCVRDRHNMDNAIVELNSLKLAENRTFADLARYVLTTLMGLCLTAPARLDPEYKALFPVSMPATDAEVCPLGYYSATFRNIRVERLACLIIAACAQHA